MRRVTGNMPPPCCFISFGNSTGKIQNGNTPLHIAASYGCLRVAKLLLDKYGADPHQQNEVSYTVRCMHYLLYAWLYIFDVFGLQGGNTPLHNACMYGHLRVADMLISDYSADINAEGYVSLDSAS